MISVQMYQKMTNLKKSKRQLLGNSKEGKLALLRQDMSPKKLIHRIVRKKRKYPRR